MKIFVVFMVLGSVCIGQTPVPANVRASFTIDQISNRNGIDSNGAFLYGISIAPGSYIGDVYLDSVWALCDIILYEGNTKLNPMFARYDLLNDGLEIKVGDQVRFLPASKVKAVTTTHDKVPQTLVNGKEISKDMNTLIQLLCDGSAALYKRVTVQVKKSDYNPIVDIGSRFDKFLKEPIYYCKMGSRVVLLPSNSRKLREQLVELTIVDEKDKGTLKGEERLINAVKRFNDKSKDAKL